MFILTDGEVWDDDDMANRIVSSVRSLPASHNTRLGIHALGIGSGVSTQMYPDIARVGNGIWQKHLRQLHPTGCWLNTSCQGRFGRLGSFNQS
ncbi:hypothetical protein PQX77_017991 [Marasmius sp. AFHP31]|nr:hypothetical protein PQX77_017991 [Marasmius sp. AFHP31]